MYKIGKLTTDNIQAVYAYMRRNGYTQLNDFIASQEDATPQADEIESKD